MLELSHVLRANCNRNCRVIAVIGLAKNAGKTTTLNALVKAVPGGLTAGLASAGRDGEPLDMLTNLPKPRINVRPGDLVATAAGALKIATAGLSRLRTLRALSPMGPITVARCELPGRVELIGPATVQELKLVIAGLREHGAELVLVDGALDRRAAAAPAVTEGLIIATGAVLSPELRLVVERTRLAADIYRLPSAGQVPMLGGALRLVDTGGGAAVMNGAGVWLPLELDSALGRAEELARAARGSEAVFLGGALVTPVLKELLREGIKRVVVRDASRVFLDAPTYNLFRAQGGVIAVLHAVRLLAVTVNPWSPVGTGFRPESFLEAVARGVAPVPVFDVVRGVAKCYE